MTLIAPFSTAMIGSMPHGSPSDALAALARHPLTIPVWPQLPKRGFRENMTVQYTDGMPGILLDEGTGTVRVHRDEALLAQMGEAYERILGGDTESFAVTEEKAAGLHEFARRFGSSAVTRPLAKGQIIGPFTCGLSLNDDDSKAVWFDEQYRDVMLRVLGAKATWMAKLLRNCARTAIIFFDEPIFSALGTPAYIGIEDESVLSVLDELAGTVHESSALMGVHCCGNMDWSLLARSAIDIISFDAYGYGDKVALYPTEIGAFLGRGGYLAFGLVPTLDDATVEKETAEGLVVSYDALVDSFSRKGISADVVRERTILTPSCGMGNLTVPNADRVLYLLEQVRDLLLAR